MLSELRIENFAIIQQLELQFNNGLITFTGETGAGKSIILDAIEALMGGRPDATFIRSGADRAVVEATFQIPKNSREEIHEILKREELLDDEDFVVLSREIRREGRNIARINGRSINISLLRELGAYLVDIHGQSEHLSLLNVRQHLHLLDRYANSQTALADYKNVYRKLTTIRKELELLRKSEREAAQRTDLLNFQIQEIESANLKDGEEEELRQERNRLANAEKLASLVQKSLIILEEGAPEIPPASDLIGEVSESIHTLSRIDPSQENLLGQMENLIESLSEITSNLQSYQEQLEFNPKRLEQAEIRLDLISNLKHKYGDSIESILKYLEKSRKELEDIQHAEEKISELEIQERDNLKQLAQKAKALSEMRQKASEALSKGVENELADLSMAGARFHVEIQTQFDPNGLEIIEKEQKAAFDETGIDQVEFLIAPNPGEGLKPLVKIASGGETSRLMLALKNVLAQADYVSTLIFDEIDQGIGGRIGSVIGEKLWQLGRQHQVLCITHLPQLAAFGDQHFCVQKVVDAGRTMTQVTELDYEARLNELAQMIGSQSEANRTAAQETLNFAHQRAAKFLVR